MVNLGLIGAVFVSSLIIVSVVLPFLIRKLFAAGMTGNDVNKADRRPVAEMGGLAIIMGVIGSLLLAIALHTFMHYELNLVEMLAAMLAMMIIALIGTYDDLFSMRQSIKAVLPMAAEPAPGGRTGMSNSRRASRFSR